MCKLVGEIRADFVCTCKVVPKLYKTFSLCILYTYYILSEGEIMIRVAINVLNNKLLVHLSYNYMGEKND